MATEPAVRDLPEALAAYARDGFVLELGGKPFVTGETLDPLVPMREIYVPYVDAALHAELDAVAAAARRRLGAGDVVVRLPPEASAPEEAGFRRDATFIAKTPGVGQPSQYDVRPATETDVEFVHELLARALVDGYGAGRGALVDAERALEYVRDRFCELDEEGAAAAVVAFSGAERVGHLTWLPESVDDVTGEPFVEIFDSFVLEPYRGRGVDAALVSYVEQRARDRARRMLGNVVAERDGGDRTVLEKLRAHGWRPEYTLWRHAA